MRAMWNKIKNWLIKKLGGYTDAEYHRINMIPPVIRKVEQSNVKHLRAEMTVFRETERMYRKDIERDLVRNLAEALGPYVRFQIRDVWAQDSVAVRAEVRVLDWSGYDG